ncbi:FadR/GntR family transcriptional regulator [Jeotgalibacillus proteolyticus]|uniref:FadR family transcriptional regulator n=1 Tax=Jeotgalibacillus proteolyticus TaxID=2082395 RepID=A0A2S5GDW3_9BACL|nr:FadR/GntR family transcriptional regulator [Jeotgalibacillus proteolyticus]PPA71105.1 FadR family transcriptional regulator [Jeotgalibacillus proteolyticus]
MSTLETIPKYKQAVEQISQVYLNGTRSIGDKLPPERELAKRLGVSRTGVREALHYLREAGVIHSRQGGGHYLRVSRLEDAKGNQTVLQLKTDPSLTAEMLEVRRAIECEAVYLAAMRANKADLDTLFGYLEAMKHTLTEEQGAKADAGFHLTIVHASKNGMLNQAAEGLISQMEKNIETTRRQRFVTDASRYQTTYLEHEAIFQAVKGNRADEAKQLMLEHLNRAYEEI